MKNNTTSLPIAVIGAGPVGLAAASHLSIRNIPFLLFEAGDSVASSILEWQHVKVFSPWRYNIDKAARELLERVEVGRTARRRLAYRKGNV